MKPFQNKSMLSVALVCCAAGLYFGQGYIVSGSTVVGLFVLYRLMRRIEADRNYALIFKQAFEDYEEIIGGRLWVTKAAEIIASDRVDDYLSRAPGPIEFEHVCRTGNDSWFIFRVSVSNGRIISRTLQPCELNDVKWRLERHPDAYVRLFGQPAAA